MSLVVIGASHRSAPLEMLERMAVDAERLPKLLDDLAGRDHVSEAVLVSTCNRTEVYVVAERFHGAYRDVRDFFADLTFLPPDVFTDHLVVAHDGDAVRHLFRVAAGLESAVVGEHEILGQLRTAWETARDQGAAGPQLNLLFRHAVETGKRARTESSIGRHVTSVSQAAVVMAASSLGSLAGRRAVVLGAGDMGRGVVQLLAEHRPADLVVVNRSAERAAELAVGVGSGDLGIRAGGLDQLTRELSSADVLFTCTAARDPLLDVASFRSVMAARQGRSLLVVDIAVPRDVDHAVAELAGVELLDMDDLARFTDAGMAERRREVPVVEAIVEDEARRHDHDVSAREVAPLIAEVRAMAEEIRRSELDRHAGRLAGLDDAQRAAVDALTQAVVAKLLHQPTVRLKDAAGTLRGERLSLALRDLLDL